MAIANPFDQDANATKKNRDALLSQMDGGAPPSMTTSPVSDPYAPGAIGTGIKPLTAQQTQGVAGYGGPVATTAPIGNPYAPPPVPKSTASPVVLPAPPPVPPAPQPVAPVAKAPAVPPPIAPAATTPPVGAAPPPTTKGESPEGNGEYRGPAQGTGPVNPFAGFEAKPPTPAGATSTPVDNPFAPPGATQPKGAPELPTPGVDPLPPPSTSGGGDYTGSPHTGGPIGADGKDLPVPGGPKPSEPPPPSPGQDYAAMRRQALIDQMTQGTGVSTSDPNIQQQLDPYAAAMERARREEVQRGAEGAFASGQDFGSPEHLAAAERAGQQVGLRGSELVGTELKAKRDEIKSALDSLGQDASDDQKNQLTMKLAELDAQLKREGFGVTTGEGAAERAARERIATQENETKIKALDSETGWRTYIANLEAKSKEAALREGGRQADQQAVLDRYKTEKAFDISKYQTDRGFDMDKLRLDADTLIRNLGLQQTGTLANRELDIRDKLGMAGLNAEMTRMLLQDRQFRDRLGFDISVWQQDQNRQALTSQMDG